MNDLLYLIAIVMVILWVLGYLVFNVGVIIHLFLLIAFFSILLKIIQGGKG